MYCEQDVPAYRGNPLIEALPPLVSKQEFVDRIVSLPPYDPQTRRAPDEVRAHLISDVFDFFLPLPRHYTLQTCLSRMIRRGYLARNPASAPLFWRQLDGKVRSVIEPFRQPCGFASDPSRREMACSSDLTAALIGISGGGKSLAVKRLLNCYPQVIEHGTYKNVPLNLRQVTWLWIEAAHKGSPNDLCLSFFRELDRLLGTNYEQSHGHGRLHEMMGGLARLAAIHSIGLLVIDEIQELSNIKSGGDKALVGFFLRLTNTMNVPILMIGTYKAAAILHSQMRHIRRSTGNGMPEWSPLTQGIEWRTFMEAMWIYQYTRTPVPMSEELLDTLFEMSQGIPDFAVKLYFLAQDRLIAMNNGKSAERISSNVIRSVAKDYMGPAVEVLDALRRKDIDRLARLDDVKLPKWEELQEMERTRGPLPPSPLDHLAGQQDAAEINGTAHKKRQSSDAAVDLVQQSNQVSRSSLLATIVGENGSDASAAYKSLHDAGIVKSGTEFISGERI